MARRLHHSGYPLNVGGIPVQSDTALLEKQQAFDRSKIQERIVHPCGWAAFGEFEVTQDVTHLTKAKMFGAVGKKTPSYTRLSTVTYGVSPSWTTTGMSLADMEVVSQREYPDSARNPRGHGEHSLPGFVEASPG